MSTPIVTEGIRYASEVTVNPVYVRCLDPDKTDMSLSKQLSRAHEELTAAKEEAACAERKAGEVAERLEALIKEQRAASEKAEQLPTLIAGGGATLEDLIAQEQRAESIKKVLPTMREAGREASHNSMDARAMVRAKKENVREIETQQALRQVQKALDAAGPAVQHYFDASGDEILLIRRRRVASPESDAEAEATPEDDLAH